MTKQTYTEAVKDHYHHPRNSGKLPDATHTLGYLNALCGDEIKLYLKLKNKVVTDISHETRGCMIAVASASVLSELAKGETLAQIKKLSDKEIAKLLGVDISPARRSCATLLISALDHLDS